jgi:hypothetical protein
MIGGISGDAIRCPGRDILSEDADGFEDSGGVCKPGPGGVPTGVLTTEKAESATVGDWRGDCVGSDSVRSLTIMGGSNGVDTSRFRSIGSVKQLPLLLGRTISIGDEGDDSPRRSLLLLAGVGGNSFSL